MMSLTEKLTNIWKEIKNQPKDIWFFYLFLLTFTLGVRKVVLYFPVKRTFNEYAGVYVYASDIFLCSTILVWITSILYNKISNTSSSSDASMGLIHKMDNAEGVNNSSIQNLSTGEKGLIKAMIYYFRAMLLGLIIISLFDHYLWDIWQGQVLFWLVCGILVGIAYLNCSTWNNSDQFGIFFIPLLLSAWSWLSLFWSENVGISFYRSVRFAELYLLFIYVALRFAPYFGQFLCNCSTWNKLELDDPEIVPRGTISTDNKLEASSNVINNVPPTFAEATAGKRGTINAIAVFFGVIIFLGVMQSLIGIAQFVVQNSLGLFWLKESLIGPAITGVAKIIVNHQPFIRAYGLFPHPNILGGFLLFSIITTLLYKKLFHVEQFENNQTKNCSTWNNLNENIQVSENVPPTFAKASAGKRGTISGSNWKSWLNSGVAIDLALLIQVFGILLSFSKSAILALVLALIYIFVPRGTISYLRGTRKFHDFDFKKNGEVEFLNCSTWNNFRSKFLKMFHQPPPRLRQASVEHFGVGIGKFALYAGFLIIVFVSLVYFKFDFQAFFVKSLEERGLYFSISERIIFENPIVGIGTGQFIFGAERLFPGLASWQYQPVHNVFLLIWSEWGIVGLVLFILFLWKLFHACPPKS